jgi:hypothetical protein
VLNINDKKSGAPFNLQDLDQTKLIALIAAIALRSFLGESRAQIKSSEVDEIYRRLVDAERSHRELIARLAHGLRTPLNNIKGAIYYLQNPLRETDRDEQEFYEIIEREVNYLISFAEEGINSLEVEHVRLFSQDIPERRLKLD